MWNLLDKWKLLAIVHTQYYITHAIRLTDLFFKRMFIICLCHVDGISCRDFMCNNINLLICNVLLSQRIWAGQLLIAYYCVLLILMIYLVLCLFCPYWHTAVVQIIEYMHINIESQSLAKFSYYQLSCSIYMFNYV